MGEHFLIEISLLIATALAGGMLFEWFGQPAILGYILAGIILGPSGIGLVDDSSYIGVLAELGVQMLLYIVGMELSLVDFKKVWGISASTALFQLFGVFFVMKTLGYFLNWSPGYILVLSISIALSSTAVAIQLLQRINQLDSRAGLLSIGILMAQDLAIIPIILLLRHYNDSLFQPSLLGKFILSILVFVVLLRYLGRGKNLKLPFLRTLAQNPELAALSGVFFCFGCAAISGLAGLSTAYGAFLGGLIIGNTTQREQLFKVIQPVQSILLAAFFVSVGLLIDIHFVLVHIVKILCLLLVILVCKTVLNIAILRILKQAWPLSFLSGIVLSQMGEFGFLIATIGAQENLIDGHGKKLILTLVALSLIASPFWLKSIRKLQSITLRNVGLSEIMGTVYDREISFLKRFHNLAKGFLSYLPRLSKLSAKKKIHVAPEVTPIKTQEPPDDPKL